MNGDRRTHVKLTQCYFQKPPGRNAVNLAEVNASKVAQMISQECQMLQEKLSCRKTHSLAEAVYRRRRRLNNETPRMQKT